MRMGIVALCLNAIKAISDSPKVEKYNVGFTAQPLLKRSAQYRGIGYSSLVLLADRLTRGEALQLEEKLWYAIRAYDKRSTVYTKFEANSDCKRYSPSYGGAPSEPDKSRPTPDILQRAQFVKNAGPIHFVDTEAAARYLALEAHTLECYRSLGGGPEFHKFGKRVRYAVEDLDAWAASCRRVTTSTPASGSHPIDTT
jgi:hypothetical protein